MTKTKVIKHYPVLITDTRAATTKPVLSTRVIMVGRALYVVVS